MILPSEDRPAERTSSAARAAQAEGELFEEDEEEAPPRPSITAAAGAAFSRASTLPRSIAGKCCGSTTATRRASRRPRAGVSAARRAPVEVEPPASSSSEVKRLSVLSVSEARREDAADPAASEASPEATSGASEAAESRQAERKS